MASPAPRRIVLAGMAITLAVAAFIISSLGGPGTDVVAVSSSSSTSSSASSAASSSSADVGRAPLPPMGLGPADGVIPDGTRASVFDEDLPAVGNLDPALLTALRGAAADAEADGIDLRVNSGWRSAAHQEQLLRDAVAEHGSPEEAARWVATPETSAHVTGDAVDVGPAEAADWLSEHGATYGLCRIYDNEPWHYELRPDAVDDGCPARYADPTEDPRMQP